MVRPERPIPAEAPPYKVIAGKEERECNSTTTSRRRGRLMVRYFGAWSVWVLVVLAASMLLLPLVLPPLPPPPPLLLLVPVGIMALLLYLALLPSDINNFVSASAV